MKPSEKQQAAVDAVLAKAGHLLIDAKAGTGKTTLLKLICQAILDDNPAAEIIYLAFNSKIKKEAAGKMPRSVTVQTCHSRGLEIIRGLHKVRVEDKKVSTHLKMLLTDLNLQGVPQNEIEEKGKRLRQLANLVRLTLTRDVQMLADRHGLDIPPEEVLETLELVRRITNDHSVIDFTDMVYRPAVFEQYPVKTFDYVLVDECQDLSVAQQRMVQRLVKPDSGMMVFVGDPGQAIYGFAGADAGSFNRIAQMPGMKPLPLDECFRCGREIIEYVNRTVDPAIKAHASTGKGRVNEAAKLEELQDGDMVLCRNTLPLVVLCYKLIGDGKKAYVEGRDIGASLVSFVDKAKARTMAALYGYLKNLPVKLLSRLSRIYPDTPVEELMERPAFVSLQEQIKIVKLIASQDGIETVDQIKAAITRIFDNDAEGICLSTIHKAKGLEAARVFLLDRHLMPSRYAKQDWELVQERNLQYVAYTRAMDYLGFISDWSGDKMAEQVIPEDINIAVNPLETMQVDNLDKLF